MYQMSTDCTVQLNINLFKVMQVIIELNKQLLKSSNKYVTKLL